MRGFKSKTSQLLSQDRSNSKRSSNLSATSLMFKSKSPQSRNPIIFENNFINKLNGLLNSNKDLDKERVASAAKKQEALLLNIGRGSGLDSAKKCVFGQTYQSPVSLTLCSLSGSKRSKRYSPELENEQLSNASSSRLIWNLAPPQTSAKKETFKWKEENVSEDQAVCDSPSFFFKYKEEKSNQIISRLNEQLNSISNCLNVAL